jgi:transposase
LTAAECAAGDFSGNPLRLILTGGQVADITKGTALVESISTDAVVADKGYDSDAFVETIQARGAAAVIPPKSNRLTPREFDRDRYKAINLVKRFFNRLKHFRRLATRYDKLAHRFNAFLLLACAYIWLLGTRPS